MSIFGTVKKRGIPKLKLLVYGKPGKGKTHFAYFAPRLKILHVLTEPQGETTIGIVERGGGVNPESESITIRSIKEWEGAKKIITENVNKFNVLVFDTLDDLEEMIGLEIAHSKNGFCIEEIDEFGKARGARDTMLQETVNWLRSLPIHVVALVHLREHIIEIGTGKEKKTITYIEPRLVGKYAVDVTTQKFNAIGIIEKRKTAETLRYEIRFRGTSLQITKDLPYFLDVEEANLENLMKKHADYYRVEKHEKANEINEVQ